MMTRFVSALFITMSLLVAGCGDGSSTSEEVKSFDSLSAEQKKAIQDQDSAIDDEESKAGMVMPKKKGR